MGKRSNFERQPRDFYPTPYEAVVPLLTHLPPEGCTYLEPCAGNGALIGHLDRNGHDCAGSYDIDPAMSGIEKMDALWLSDCPADYIITNPPWERRILHPLIEHLSGLAPTWLLFDADWMHTKQAIPHLAYCHKILSIGRVKWFSNTTGKDNAAWYLFDQSAPLNGTKFFGRVWK